MRIISSILLVCLLCFVSSLQAQCVETNGPFGLDAIQIAASGDTIFVSNDHGIFISSDAGAHFSIVSSLPSSSASVERLVFKNGILGVVSLDIVYFSTDAGNHWTTSGVQRTIVSIEICRKCIYANTDDGIFRSIDTGNNWSRVDSGLTKNGSFAVVAIGKGDTALALTGDGLYLTKNEGTTWDSISNWVAYGYSLIVFQNALYSSSRSSGVYRSTDLGTTWQLLALCGFNDTMLASTPQGIYRSTNKGLTWSASPVDHGLPLESYNFLLPVGSNLYCVIQHDLYYSTDGGATWRQRALTKLSVASLVQFGQYLFASAATNPFRSSDNGDSWIPLFQPYQIFFADSTRIYSTNTSGIFYSVDTGEHWQSIGPMGGGFHLVQFATWGNNFFVLSVMPAGGDLYLTSSDGGKTWIDKPLGISSIYEFHHILLATTTTNQFLLRSSDSGATWQDEGRHNFSQYASIGNVLFAAASDSICESRDSGQTWIRSSFSLPGKQSISCFVSTGNSLFAVASNGIVYRSDDSARTWTELSPGLPNAVVTAMLAANRYLFACPNGGYLSDQDSTGVWRIPLANQAVRNAHSTSLTAIQNYPNPFRGSTTIQFDLNHAASPSVSICDALGRTIAEWQFSNLTAGSHSIKWDSRTGLRRLFLHT